MAFAARSKKTCPRCGSTFEPSAVFCPTDGTPLEPHGEPPSDSDPYIGAVIHGDVELRSVAGAGAMGRVYRAHQRGVDRDVAVKILHRELSGNLPLVQRFHREAKIASKLQHPHVVDVYAAGQLPDGALYIVMEYLDGLSLAAALEAAGRAMALERALPIALQICDAVGEGHARGIIHRDLKPENVMLVRRADTSDWVKVLDFGIAKVSLGEQSMETAAGLIFGTARYISPEGAQGATVRPPGDVYSIAVILYQLLSGHTPFDAEQPVGLLIKHIHDTPPPLRSWPASASIPEPIERVIMDNLAKEPACRLPNARALGHALAGAAKEANVPLSDVGVVARMSMSMSTLDAPNARETIAPAPHETPSIPSISSVPSIPPTSITPLRPPHSAPDALAETTAEEPAPYEVSERPPPPATLPAKKRTSIVVALAFMLGVVLTALVMQQVSRGDVDRTAHIMRTRHAVARGDYIEPPGDNVRDLVTVGLTKWPNDAEFIKIQSDAAHEVVTRAMAARSGGDIVGARDLAKTAHDLDPTDGTARLLLAQYEEELIASSAEARATVSNSSRVTIDLPAERARPNEHAELVARIILGPGREEISGARFLVTGPGLASDGLVIPGIGAGPFRGTFAPPSEGSYKVEFTANAGGTLVRAHRTFDVRP